MTEHPPEAGPTRRGAAVLGLHLLAVAGLLVTRPALPVAAQDATYAAAMALLGLSGLLAWVRGMRTPALPRAWHGFGAIVVGGLLLRGLERVLPLGRGRFALPIVTVAVLGAAVLLWRAFRLHRLSSTDRLDAVLCGLSAATLASTWLVDHAPSAAAHDGSVVAIAGAGTLTAAILLSARHLRLSPSRLLLAAGIAAQGASILLWPAPWTGADHIGQLLGSSAGVVGGTLVVLALHRAALAGPQSSAGPPVVRGDIAWWAPTALAITVLLVVLLGAGQDQVGAAAHLLMTTAMGLVLLARVVLTVIGLQRATAALDADRRRYHRQARTDPLTGLPNRAALVEHLREALAGARPGAAVSALFCDLDRVKVVNDALGHDVGDQLIRAVAQRWRGVVDEAGGLLARIGGDEFVAVHRGPAAGAQALADRLHAALADPVGLDGVALTARTSVGLASATDPGVAVEALLRDADAAMYRAKAQGGRSTVVFDETIGAQARTRMAVEEVVAAATATGRVAVHLQPIIDLASGQVASLEALLRLHDDAGAPVDAATAVAVAEEAGLIGALGEAVLDRALEALRTLRARGHAIGSIAVNTSVSQLLADGFPEAVRAALARHDLPPQALAVEVTESVLLETGGPAQAALEALSAMGVRISTDDFGSGWSSLGQLGRVPTDQIKLDGSFLDGAPTPATDAVLGGVIAIGHALGVPVVAERVETAEQVVRLHRLGCDLAQGWFFCRALPPDDLLAWLEAGGVYSRDRDRALGGHQQR